MNNIYKVIWSKAKNCYVVASEIARSHTKSASGSEKIGGSTRRKLLASLMALSLLCGGLGVASAANGTVDVEDIKATATSQKVYTADKVDALLADYGRKDEVETNKNNIKDLQNTTMDQGNQITANTTNIGTNKAAIEALENDKLRKDVAIATYATKTELSAKADTAALAGKADKEEVTTALEGKANKADVYSKTGADDKFATKDALNNKADKTYVDNAVADVDTKLESYATTTDVDTKLAGKADKTDLENATNRIAANEGNITTLQNKTAKLSPDGTALNGMTTVETDALKVKGAISNGAGVTTTLTDINNSMTQTATNKDDITTLKTKTDGQQTAIDDLKKKTTKIGYDAANDTTSINGIKVGDQVDMGGKKLTNVGTINGIDIGDAQVDMKGKNLTGVGTINGTEIGTKEGGAYIDTDSSIWGNMKKVDTQVGKNAKAIAQEKTDREEAIGSLTGDKNYIKKANNVSDNLVELDKQAKTNADNIQTNADNIKNNKDEIARVNGELVKTNDYFNAELGKTNDYFNKELSKTNNHFNTELGKTNAALQATNKRTAGIDRIDATSETTIEKNVTVDNKGNVTAKGKLKGEVVDAGAVNAGSLSVENASTLKGDVTMDKKLSVTGDTSLGKTDVGGALTVTGESNLQGNVILGKNTANTVTVNGTAHFNEAVNMDNGLTVDKGLNVTNGDTNLKDTTVTGNLKVTGTITTDKMIFGDKANNNYTEIDHGKVTSKNLVVNRPGQIISSSSTFNEKENEVGFTNTATGDHSSHKQTADGIKDTVKNNITGDQSFHKQTSDVIMDNVKDGKNSNNRTQTKTETKDIITDENGNSSTTSQTASENKTYLKDKDGKNTNSTIDTATGYDKIIKGENGETSTKQTATDITHTAQNGTITNDAKDIVNNATGDMTNIVGGKLTTTVKGQATEDFKGGLDTTVTGAENHTVTGKQTNTVKGGQENIISGGQINNITGDQTTTVTGKVTENYKAGQATNVTGNQDIHVTKNQTNKIDGDQVNIIGGSQTTTATDINRNASSSMVDKVDNAYGTNTETKEAGKTTTDVSIKGTGEKGKYIRGANESRDYLIKGTLTNSETKTVEKTSTEITDGNGKTSATIQDKTQISGSVTNGTSSAVSNVKADSIDTAVIEGTNTSLISQKKDSITSAVGNGATSTVIKQGDKDITIASNGGTVGIVGKDIINNATNEITNTAGTKITDQVGSNTRVIDQTSITDTVGTANRKIEDGKITDTAGDFTVTTENGKGTTFAKTGGSAAYSTGTGAPTDTNIAGNHITTGRVDANELGVSDKDGTNTADLSVEAGKGVKASAGNGTTTGSLDVKADEIGSSVTDASGKGSTFKQRIDAIMMESKNVSIKAEETLTNEAKDIVTNASNSITEKVGETNVTTKTTTSSKSEIQNADTITSVQQTENMVQSYVGKKDLSATNVTTNFANASANQVTENGQTSTVLNNKDGLLIQNTANGNSFTTADGTNTGTALAWTNVKGNEISTGKVEANYVKMDYADVMKDLGVRGNANITGKTTTGSLEVKGESKLTGDVTMESNATVKKDLNVEGITTTKTLKVTENAEVDGTLKVAKKATFKDSVDIARDLTVGGNATIAGDVTAKSYKVGDKTYISAAGINANDQKITNVADGSISEGSKDAVNGGQLYGMKTDLEHKVDKVGANAAAMANLHPMEFDPDSKWNIAAAMGNYGSETATAIGAFYRPNEDVMVNFSTAFGTGENMVGGGVSVRLGKGSNKLSREESNALKAQVNDLTARMDALLSVLNPNMSKDFPDVPENHWAYEAVSRLAGNDIVQGYPDGEFHGERTMTRYEMAEIIYNALSRGAEAEKELVEEFKPELQAMAASEKATAERAEG